MNWFAIFFILDNVKAVEVVQAADMDEAKFKAAELSKDFGAPVDRIIAVGDEAVEEAR